VTFYSNRYGMQWYQEIVWIIFESLFRSACYAALEMWEEAAQDGQSCIVTDKNFVKGYFRQALALQNLVRDNNLTRLVLGVMFGIGKYRWSYWGS
jgi:hypothetical protein